MRKFLVLAMAACMMLALTGCPAQDDGLEPDDSLCDGHLTQLLEDLQEPGMTPVFNEETGHWEAVEVE